VDQQKTEEGFANKSDTLFFYFLTNNFSHPHKASPFPAPMTFRLSYDFRIDTDFFHFHFEEGTLSTAHVRQSPGHAVVVLPRGFRFDSAAAQEWTNKVLVGVLREHARALLPKRLKELAQEYGYQYNRCAIKDVYRRWGSCSSLNNINLSLWLLLAPTELIDYVLKHELAHLREMNHGPRFWQELDRTTNGKGRELRRRMRAFSLQLFTQQV
jgi:predicted metal-dependent hydrolase